MTDLEGKVQAKILHRIGSRHDCVVWRNNVGLADVGDNRKYRFGIPGQADITGLVNLTGRRLEIEVKRLGHAQIQDLNDNQKIFRRVILDAGGIYVIVDSADAAEEALDIVCENERQRHLAT